MSSDDHHYSERRNFIRMFVDAAVTITDPQTREVFQGDSKNLSGDGVMFVTDKEFTLDQQLQVDISSQQSQLPPLSASFQVIRVNKLDDGRFEIAGKLNQVS